ncbi:diguanylate cyclase domain-containing protein [Thiohalophilus sp.]|uniref:diguanylate cyclase domain-containing protein n=1 Tax=Thiohalophilus sp. TaxID=3028392 RepID=UPI003975B096
MKSQRPLSPQSLLLASFALVILLTFSLTGISLYYLINYGTNMTRAVHAQNLKLNYAYTMRTAARERALALFAKVSSEDPFQRDQFLQRVLKQGSIFIKARKNLEQLELSGHEAQRLERVIAAADNTAQYTYQIIELLRQEKLKPARQIMMQNMLPNIEILLERLDRMIAREQSKYQSTLSDAASAFESSLNILIPLGMIIILLITLIAAYVFVKTSHFVRELSNFTGKLKLQEKRERLILQGVFDAVITTDERGIIQDFNTRAQQMFGYSQQEALGENISIIMPEEHSKSHDKYMKNYTSTGKTTVMGKGRELLGKRKNGSVFPIEVALTECRLDDSKIFIGTIRDITRQKEYEADLRATQAELEKRVEQRTWELQRANEKLEQLANFDTLTGLPNRFRFTTRFKQELSSARRHQHELALLYADIDGFKEINDTFGHESGDILLQEMAARLRSVVREEDTIARIGGDEFTLIAVNIDTPNDAIVIAEKIIAIINQPLKLKDNAIDIGVSIGISCFPKDGTDMDSLTRHADLAMYQAKQTGKNRYYVYHPNLK